MHCLTDTTLTHESIHKKFHVLEPLILDEKFMTSAVTACLLKLSNGHYAPGVLVQDIAFLTLDAVYSAIAVAITEHGQNIEIVEVHVYGEKIATTLELSGQEQVLLHRYMKPGTFVYQYNKDGLVAHHSFHAD